MFAEKYFKTFLMLENNKAFKSIIDRIVQKEEEYKTPSIKWTLEQIEDFLKSTHSTSPNTITRSLSLLRNFNKFISESENISYLEIKLEHGRAYDLIDYEKLLSTILSFNQYKTIVRQLINTRDKVIFDLAWNGLSSDEIKNLKIDSIDINNALLKLTDTKIIKVEDEEVMENIKRCIETQHYLIITKEQIRKKMSLKNSDNLIKPVIVGRNKAQDFINNPTITLINALIQQQIECDGVNISEITIESIKNSGLIYLMTCKKLNFKEIIDRFDMGNSASRLYWLRRIGEMKYDENFIEDISKEG